MPKMLGVCFFILVLLPFSSALEINPRVAIVYSNTTYNVRHEVEDFDGAKYLLEFSSTQQQLMMAGIPFDIIGEKNLTDTNVIARYNLLVLPSLSYVPSSIKDEIVDNLEIAVKDGLDVYAVGDLIIGDEEGSSFSYPPRRTPWNRILNAQKVGSFVDADIIITAMESPATWRYSPYEGLNAADWYGYTEYEVFNASKPYFYPFQAYDLNEFTYHPVAIATKNGKGNTFYSSHARLTAQSAIGRDAVLWLLYGDKPHFGIKITNSSAIFSVRVDADDSGDTDYDILAINNFIDIMTKNGLVAGWYITTNNEGGNLVEWDEMRPYYGLLMSHGFEIGSHSIHHYDDINLEPDNVVWDEFYGSKQIIESELGINITGYANAGNTPLQERLWRIADEAGYKYYSPLQIENYKGFGYASDEYDVINLQANMISDYELMDIQKLNDNQVTQYWTNEFNKNYRWGDGILIFGLWHDYLLYNSNKYNAYYNFAKYVNASDTESMTPDEAVQRFIDWTKEDFVVRDVNGGWSVTRLSPDTKYGQITFPEPIKYFTGTNHLKPTPDNRSYVFTFESDTAAFYFNMSEINIILAPGWNLVSFPIKLSNDSLQNLFNESVSVFGYNGSFFVPKEIDNKQGYWVRSNTTKGIILKGQAIENKSISLRSGWNLIGFPYLEARSIFGNSTIYSYNGSWSSYNPGGKSSLEIMKPGFGYFVKVQ
jgi:hypothetical protein